MRRGELNNRNNSIVLMSHNNRKIVKFVYFFVSKIESLGVIGGVHETPDVKLALSYTHFLRRPLSAMPYMKVVMSSVVWGLSSGQLTGPYVVVPTGITLGQRYEYCSRKRVRPSSPILGKIKEVVKPQPRFLVMSRVENDEDLKCVSPFILERVINGAAKSEVSIRKMRDGIIMIQTTTDTQSSNIKAISEIPLSNTTHTPVKVEPHKFLNVCKGVVTCYELDCARKEYASSQAPVFQTSYSQIFSQNVNCFNCNCAVNLAKTPSRPVPLVSARDTRIENVQTKSSPPPVPPSSAPRGTPPSPPRGTKTQAAGDEPLTPTSGLPEVGVSCVTGEAAKASPTGALRKDQRETAEKNNPKKASKVLTKPARKDTTTHIPFISNAGTHVWAPLLVHLGQRPKRRLNSVTASRSFLHKLAVENRSAPAGVLGNGKQTAIVAAHTGGYALESFAVVPPSCRVFIQESSHH
uniref:Uncharacterized protein n=1 Tax=Timema douglasi TaxID=61478 RepID=A0A7R8VY16_TIMDO|nr:unnamed protein product [Timema douglasi]